MEERSERLYEREVGREPEQTASSENDKTTILMNRHCYGYLYKTCIRPSQAPFQLGVGKDP